MSIPNLVANCQNYSTSSALLEVFVSPTGILANPGTVGSPTTLEGAQAIIRAASRAVPGILRVTLRGGIYPRTSTFALTSADSGSTNNPIEWVAYPGETPRIIGGVSLNPASLSLATSGDVNWSRLNTSARSFIYTASLSAYSASLGTFTSRHSDIQSGGTNQAMEVFADGIPMTLARYPKEVDATTVNLGITSAITVSGSLTPDITGNYAYIGVDAEGRPYYQLSKLGTVWTIGAAANSPQWQISNTAETVFFGAYDNFSGPVGRFEGVAGGSGLAYATPANGTAPVPGLTLSQATNGTTTITAPSSRMSTWNASEARYYGLSYWAWWGDHSAVTSFNSATGLITLTSAPTLGIRMGQPFFLYNLLEELTDPGDYFIDRTNNKLYIRPVGDVLPSEILLSTLQNPIMSMTSCTKITWSGVSFEAAKDILVSAPSCTSVSFYECEFKNNGGIGLNINGSSNKVQRCDFRYQGQTGITAWGGDRATLTPSGTLIENNEIQYFARLFWTYQPGIQILNDPDFNQYCMGFTVQHNEIHHGPHDGIIYNGNNIVIQYNHIHHVDQWTSDAGAIYTTGCEWGTQGNQIKFNLVRECGGPLGGFISGIYIDGGGSGVDIECNILYNSGLLCGIQHNGGRDVQMRYNICSGAWYGIDISNVIFSIINNDAGSQTNFLEKLQYFNYQSAPWSTTYPNLAVIPNTYASIPGTHWCEPENSVCYGNLQYGFSTDSYRQTSNYATGLGAITTFFSQVAANTSGNPLFTNTSTLDFSLQVGSPMLSISGFPGINTTLIGIQP